MQPTTGNTGRGNPSLLKAWQNATGVTCHMPRVKAVTQVFIAAQDFVLSAQVQ